MSTNRLLLIHAETPMHPGTGTALGTVDLPVARERHTEFPLIPASSLKGVLRDACQDAAQRIVVFGPEPNRASDHAGALAITDARILAFPLRSMAGLFAWVTCPLVLQRLARDLRMVGNAGDLSTKADAAAKLALNPDNAFVASNKLLSNSKMILEEFDYTAEARNEVKELGAALAGALGDSNTLRLGTHLAVIPDDAFVHSVKHATEVSARIAIDPESKTVKDGALFYEEFLPAGTIFYAIAMADPPRAEEDRRAGIAGEAGVIEVLTKVLGSKGGILQIGGNATIGKGICTVVLAGGA